MSLNSGDSVKTDIQNLIDQFNLVKHPEGGYFKEVYQSREVIAANALSVAVSGQRSLASSIYFLLPSDDVSRFHRLKFDEIWYYHGGSSLTIVMIDAAGNLSEHRLGPDCGAGELPQIIIPGGNIFGAFVNRAESYSLVGCLVCPGFDYQDFELLSRQKMLADYPQHQETILRLT